MTAKPVDNNEFKQKRWVMHSWTPIFIKGGGVRTFQKKGGINMKRGVDVQIGGCHFFTILQLNLIYCVCRKSKVYYFLALQFFELAIQDSHQAFIVLTHCIICIFLINAGSVQKKLTVSFR